MEILVPCTVATSGPLEFPDDPFSMLKGDFREDDPQVNASRSTIEVTLQPGTAQSQ